MKASYFGPMGYSQRHLFPASWPIPPSYHDPETSVQSYQEGMEECEFAEEMGFEWISFSEHHYSGRDCTFVIDRKTMFRASPDGLDTGNKYYLYRHITIRCRVVSQLTRVI